MEMSYNASMANKRINFRLTGKDSEDYEILWQRALKRSLGEAKITNFIKELIGRRRPKLVTQAELDWFSGRSEFLPEEEQFSGGGGLPPMISAKTGKRIGRR